MWIDILIFFIIYEMPINTDSGFGIIPSSISGFFGTSIKNPFWFALLVTVCIILIIIFVYPAKKSASISKLFKLMIYIFIAFLVFIMLHDNALHETWKTEHEDQSARNMIGNMSDFINNGSKPIIPTNFENDQNIAPAQPRVNSVSSLLG